jgi:hypothetical protein
MASIEIDGVNGVIKSTVSDADLTIKGNDGGSETTAVTFDMSDAGTAVFNHDIKLANDQKAIFGTASNMLTVLILTLKRLVVQEIYKLLETLSDYKVLQMKLCLKQLMMQVLIFDIIM